MLGGSLGSTNEKSLVSDEGIKLWSNDGKVLGTILGNVYGITLGIDIGTYLVPLDGLFDGSNDVNIEGLLPVESLGYTDGKLFGYNEGINCDLIIVKWLALYLDMYME